ncbi:protein of unknown function YGGT [Beutenbergia cavernae DSM 12333]|uniref:YggT family protein n=1 Tax=Beutenbergia cavernae (strain ATCC BAA-8 / DSM 12333 / CCUG 43141 / JCM 11478 / NBRC 16432 / NCIMB 13614 / HKI 0122) TaxID=471853 RepID=C5BW53_BEUC1|nr:YggT family protein [Beutenbergia cavernae]ACQ80654.1 protein of unknown function YGGT [Beutenbergia cavernae DSM 12333]
MLGWIASIAYLLVLLFIVAMLIRIVFDLIQVFSREWRPQGVTLVLAEAVYTVTDPPIKLVRRVIPPLRIGGVAIDLAFLVVMIVASFLLQILSRLA